MTNLQGKIQSLQGRLKTLDEALAELGKKPPAIINAETALHADLDAVLLEAKRHQARFDQLEQLVKMSTLLNASLDVDHVVEDALDTIIEITGAERAYLMLYDSKRQLETRGARNWDQETVGDHATGLSRSVIDEAIKTNTPIITTNAQADERFRGQSSVVSNKLRSIMCVPLALGGACVGVLYADNRHVANLFQADLMPLLTAFGTQAAIAILNAQRFRRAEESLRQAEQVIRRLTVEIDRDYVDYQIERVTEDEYFNELVEAAAGLRQRAKAPGQPRK